MKKSISIKKDPRFEGARLANKGIVLFCISVAAWVICFNYFDDSAEKIISFILKTLALTGLFIALAGIIKHYKIFFGPTDPRREIDPGYDFEYVICPHCRQTKIRVVASKLKCPVCKKKIKI